MALEAALKERLVGAVVLVALGVWLIPVFLDGPAEPQQENSRRTLELPVPPAAPAETQTRTIRLDPAELAQAKPAPATSTPATPDASDVAEPVSKPAATANTAVPDQAPATGKSSASRDGWFVQLGSFGSEANAERLAARVNALGWEARLSEINSGTQTLHRVRVGPVPTRSKAEALRRELAARGLDGRVMSES